MKLKLLGLLQLGLCAASEEPHAARVDVKQIASIPIDTWSGRVARAEGFARIESSVGRRRKVKSVKNHFISQKYVGVGRPSAAPPVRRRGRA